MNNKGTFKHVIIYMRPTHQLLKYCINKKLNLLINNNFLDLQFSILVRFNYLDDEYPFTPFL